ncbi:MAG: SDR family oxidoreductase [Clostridia bacterium]|nr:SDR family oxidoreductase [Clostridia bacterium]
MKAVITGANSGIGKSLAIELANMGYDIVAIARNPKTLEELKKEISSDCEIIVADVSKKEICLEVFEKLKNEDIDIFINNAGFGVYGKFDSTDYERELEMIDVNIKAVHIFTKLFIKKFLNDGKGKILNVASTAGFMPGPNFSSYYASKSYVLRLSEAVDEEVRRKNKNICVCVLCPGPVKTAFDKSAGVGSSFNGANSDSVAKYAIKKFLKGKRIIIPGFSNKMLVFISKFVPEKLLTKINYNIQARKQAKK